MTEGNKPRPNRLSARFVDTIKIPGVYSDGPGAFGLKLRVTVGAKGKINKYYFQSVTLHRKQRTIGIGSHPLVTLAEAREKALENARLVHVGIDPVAVNKLKGEAIPTFAEATEIVITQHRKEWKEGGSTERSWRGVLKRHALPKIGHLRVHEVTEDHIIDMLTPLWDSKRPTANMLQAYTKDIFAWCRRKKYRSDNPVSEFVREHAPRRGHKTENFRFVPYYQIGSALQAIRKSKSGVTIRLLQEFQIFTACRHVEARKARWSEIDWENRIWTIPASHAKMKRQHQIPLSTGAMAVLKQALQMKEGDSDLIFPSPYGGGIISASSLAAMCRQLNLSGVPHGFRATFATWCAEMGVPQELTEASLAHMPSAIIQAYTHTDYLERRKVLMQMWSDYLDGKLPDGWTYAQSACVCGGAINRTHAA